MQRPPTHFIPQYRIVVLQKCVYNYFLNITKNPCYLFFKAQYRLGKLAAAF